MYSIDRILLHRALDDIDAFFMEPLLMFWRTDWVADMEQGSSLANDKKAFKTIVKVHRSAYYLTTAG